MNSDLRQFLKKYWIAAKRNNWNFRRVSEEYAKNLSRSAHKSKIPLKLLGLSIEKRHEIFFILYLCINIREYLKNSTLRWEKV